MRFASVPYINALPLTHYLGASLVKLPPAKLADVLHEGHADVALMPVFGALREGFFMYPECGIIGCDGRVDSVGFFIRSGLPDIREAKSVYWDQESLTAAHLGRLLLRRFWQMDLQAIEIHSYDNRNTSDLQLLIGDQALFASADNPHYVDLGETWKAFTGLGFIFACWCSKRALTLDERLLLTRAKQEGLLRLPEIIATLPAVQQYVATEYLSKRIRYELSPSLKEGLALYQRWLKEDGYLLTVTGD